MADALINAIGTALSDAQTDDSTKLLPIATASSGLADRCTVGQIKKVTSTQRIKYIATGLEGTTLVIAALATRTILGIWREGMCMYDVTVSPTTVEYIWDGTTITFGTALNVSERLLILWKNT